MDRNFVFPRHPAVRLRPAPSSSKSPGTADVVNRDSNALRASVLDAALELGLGNNSTVANWMFNNSVEEAEEEVSCLHCPSSAL